MKKIFLLLSIVFTLSFLGCGSSGGGGSSSPDSDTNSDGSVTKTLSSTNDSTKVNITGENGEKLSLDIPALPAGSQDTEVNFKLDYTNGLPTLIIDTDIEFTSEVILTLQSSTFSNGEYTIVYLGDDAQQYSIVSTQDKDTLTATLTHFSSYATIEQKSQSTIEANTEAHLTSWETNNASKSIEDIGMTSINSLYADILSIDDSTKKDLFSKRFEDAVLVLASNSLNEWRTQNLDYFSKYCLTETFKNTVTYFQQLYTFFGKFGSSNDEAFEMLQDELIILVNKHLENSYTAWSAISLPTCDAIDTPAYVKCASDYDYFVDFVSSIYFGAKAKFSTNNDIMGNVKSKITAAVNSIANNPDACDCFEIYHSVVTEYFSEEIGLLNDIDLYITTNCANDCPYLWNISYTHDYMSSESGDPAHAVAHADFKNVIIYPRGAYFTENMSSQEIQACSPYMDDNGYATQTKAVDYEWTEDGYEVDNGAPSFSYACTRDSTCEFRDQEWDTPFNKLDAGYITGDSLGQEWKQYGYPSVYLTIEEDIFEEIYKRDAFSISDSKAQMSFTPVSIK